MFDQADAADPVLGAARSAVDLACHRLRELRRRFYAGGGVATGRARIIEDRPAALTFRDP